MERHITLHNIIFAAICDLNAKTQEEPRNSNDSPRIRQMLANTGIYQPAFWCAAATSTWILEGTSAQLDATISASCDRLLEVAYEKKFLRSTPQVGDIFLKMKSENDAVHTGLVLRTDSTLFETIEGNTNDEGSRDGYEVCKRTRYIGNSYKFFSPADFTSTGKNKKPSYIPTLEINGVIFACPYNFTEGRLYAHCASFYNKVNNHRATRDIIEAANLESYRNINGYGYARLRDLYNSFAKPNGWLLSFNGESKVAKLEK